eukprot:6195387-Pleurochrysis_carterae.AAC.1
MYACFQSRWQACACGVQEAHAENGIRPTWRTRNRTRVCKYTPWSEGLSRQGKVAGTTPNPNLDRNRKNGNPHAMFCFLSRMAQACHPGERQRMRDTAISTSEISKCHPKPKKKKGPGNDHALLLDTEMMMPQKEVEPWDEISRRGVGAARR